MKSNMTSHPPGAAAFIAETGKHATGFGWPAKSFERDGEVVLVALTETDPSFERFIWVYNIERVALRCMLVGKEVVPAKKEPAILELCARVNEGLPFGCLEYSFSDRVLVFRDSADLDWGPLDKVVSGTTSRVLNLGQRYAIAIQAALKGEKPEAAVKKAQTA
jgi:hypothetical protein